MDFSNQIQPATVAAFSGWMLRSYSVGSISIQSIRLHRSSNVYRRSLKLNGKTTETLTHSAQQMAGTALQMTNSAKDTSSKAAAVAGSANRVSENSQTASGSARKNTN